LQNWFRPIIQGRWFRGSNRRWWASVTEAVFAAVLLLTGVVLLSTFITLAIISSRIGAEPTVSRLYFVVQLLIASALIIAGVVWIVRLLWHVGVSAERRGAITARTGDIEILNERILDELHLTELRKRRDDLPTVPRDRLLPQAGRVLGVRILPSPRNVWGLMSSALFSVVSVSLLSILVLICAQSFEIRSPLVSQLSELSEKITPKELSHIPSRPWLAVGLLLVFIPACGWSIYHFFRQLLKLAGIGPTSIELSSYPLKPGCDAQLFLSQTGRVRLQVLDVDLVCEEEVTYNQGTDIRTEQAVVYEERLLRQRGVSLRIGRPYETQLALSIPSTAMHSFKSTNNRVQWKIIVTAKAKSWPRLHRTFRILVHPNSHDLNKPPKNQLAGKTS
jgi:hypothetical protein